MSDEEIQYQVKYLYLLKRKYCFYQSYLILNRSRILYVQS